MNLSFLKKIKKQYIAVFLFLIFAGIMLPHQAFGSALSSLAEGALFVPLQILRAFLLLIMFGLSLVLGLAASFLDMAITLSMNNIASAYIVQVGSTIIRDVANMFFIVVLLIMAFATILRIPNYGAKENLPKLIIGALLINFSVVIVTPLIDFSQVLVKYFSSAIPDGFGASLKFGMNLAAMWDPNSSYFDKFLDTLWVSFPDIVSHFLNIAVLIVAIVAFAAGFFFLIVRMIALWLLLIFSPIVWIAWALPATKKYWDDWWTSFLKWVMFAPVYVFLLYLSILTTGGLLAQIKTQTKINISTADWFTNSFLGDPMKMMSYFLTMGLMIGSLIVAQKAGVIGAGAAMKLGKSLGQKTGGWIGGKSRSAFGIGTAITAGLVNRQQGESRRSAGTRNMNTIVRAVEKFPLIGRAIGGPGAQRERQRKEMDEAKKNYTHRDSNDLLAMVKQPTITIAQMQARAAVLELLAERGKLGDKDMEDAGYKDPKDIRELLQTAQTLGAKTDDILKVRIDWAPHLDKDINKKIEETKSEDAYKLHQDALKNGAVTTSIGEHFDQRHYSNIASKGTQQLKADVQNEIIDNKAINITNDNVKYYFADPIVQNNTGWEPRPGWTPRPEPKK